jgi:hypothetical protein
MKNKKIAISLLIAGLVCHQNVMPAITFMWEAVSFERQLSIRENEARKMPPEVAIQIINDAKHFAQLHTKDKNSFDYRISKTQSVELPESIQKLQPRRIAGEKNRIMISLLFMMDTGGELYVSEGKDGLWILEGNFGERASSFRIHPK